MAGAEFSANLSPDPRGIAGYTVHSQEPALHLCRRPAFGCLILLGQVLAAYFPEPQQATPRDSGSQGSMPRLQNSLQTEPRPLHSWLADTVPLPDLLLLPPHPWEDS